MAVALETIVAAAAAAILLPWLFFKILLCGNAKFHRTLNGKHVVITGGSTGIGLALARRCVLEGAFVTLMARTETNLRNARSALLDLAGRDANRVQIQAVDVSDAAVIVPAIQECFKSRPIDILVCNAGVAKSGMFDEISIEDLEMMTRINLMGSVYPVHAVLPLMKKRSLNNPSSIVFIASLSAMMFSYGMNLYTSTKYAHRGLAELLRMELIPYKIRVSMVCPGFTKTSMLEEADKVASTYKELNKICMYDRNKAETPEDVARTTVEGVKKGEFLITTGWSGFVVGLLGRGVIPAESIGRAVVELILLVPMRIVTFAFSFYIRRVIDEEATARCRSQAIQN